MAIQAWYQNDYIYIRLECDSCECPIRKHTDGIFFNLMIASQDFVQVILQHIRKDALSNTFSV